MSTTEKGIGCLLALTVLVCGFHIWNGAPPKHRTCQQIFMAYQDARWRSDTVDAALAADDWATQQCIN